MRFADVLVIRNGRNQRQVECPNGKYPIYGSGGVMGHANSYICEANTVVIGRKGNINSPIFVEEPFWNVDTAFGLIPHADVLIPKYLFYFCENYNFDKLNTTVTIPSLTKANLLQVEIDVPEIGIQKSRVGILDKIEHSCRLLQQEAARLDQLVKSRFVEMFGTIDDNRFGYKECSLQDVCEPIKDGTHQTPEYTDDTAEGYKFLSSKDVTSGMIDWTHLKYIPEYLHRELYARIAPRKGDILLAKNGTTGVAAIVDRDEVFDIYVSLALIRPLSVDTTYLWAAINSTETKRQFDRSLKGIGVPNLHLGEIKKVRILHPPKDKQNRFAAFVSEVDKSKLAVKQSLEKLETLKKSLMQQYFG